MLIHAFPDGEPSIMRSHYFFFTLDKESCTTCLSQIHYAMAQSWFKPGTFLGRGLNHSNIAALCYWVMSNRSPLHFDTNICNKHISSGPFIGNVFTYFIWPINAYYVNARAHTHTHILEILHDIQVKVNNSPLIISKGK